MSDDIVQAQFKPGGRVYHYNCPTARIGDRIHADGMHSDSAEVVGFGRTNGYTGYCKPAWVVQRGKPMSGAEMAYLQADGTWLNGALKKVQVGQQAFNHMQINFTDELRDRVAVGQQAHIPIYKEVPAMHDFPPLNRPATAEDRIEQMERILKQEKKAAKAARKTAAKAKADAKERARLRAVALKALEAVAIEGHGEARVQAAVELLNNTAR